MTDKVVLYNTGIGDEARKANIASYNDSNIGATHLKYDDDGNIDIIAIDDLTFNEKIDVIKIDVEGFEPSVIRGMTNTLKKNSPVIWVEIFDDNYQEMQSLMTENSYTLVEKIGDADYIYRKMN